MDQTSDLSTLTEKEIQDRLCKLHQELDRRKAPQPTIRREMAGRFEDVFDMCVEHVKALNGEGSDIKDLEHYMYEKAMEAVYGTKIWEWVRTKC